ncbi:LamG domain-containing protein, partial [Patescibacteria group bacterium]|nr:LamG domain-containing protein [Patescibacteria group bacterium]
MEEGKGQTVYDRSGNGNNGTLGASTSVAKDDPVFTSGYSSAGAGGTGLKFDGVNDYVNAGSGSSLNITSSFTFDVWIKPNTVSLQYQDIISRGINNNYRYDLFLNYDEVMIFIGYRRYHQKPLLYGSKTIWGYLQRPLSKCYSS